MLLRICLIIAILGGGAAAAVKFRHGQEKHRNHIAARDKEEHDKKDAQGKLKKPRSR